MIRGINTINANMNVLQKKQENISNNIANTNTPGFKYQEAIDKARESHTMVNYTGGKSTNQRRELGDWVFRNEIDELYTHMEQGSLMETGDPLDYAVIGDGFFSVNTLDGQRAYTRNGNFTLDEDNILVTMEGHQVVGRLRDGTESPILVNNNGEIINGTSFRMVDFPGDAQLERLGETLFLDLGGQAEEIGNQPRNKFLEMSNVVVADEMVRLIQVAREFEASQKALQSSDETLSKAVNEVGRT